MKTKDIAEKFDIDRKDFEEFLLSNNLEIKGGAVFGYTVDDCNVQEYVDKYVETYNSYLHTQTEQRKANAIEKSPLAEKRKEENWERIKAAQVAAEVKREAEKAAAEEKRKAALAAAEEKRKAALAAAVEWRKAEEAAAEERRKAEEAAAEERRKVEEAAAEIKRRAEEEKERRIRAAAEERRKRIEDVRNEILGRGASEAAESGTICEGRGTVITNYVKLYKEKLKGKWEMCGASYADNDIFGLWLTELIYTGIDGESHIAVNGTVGEFAYEAYLTGDESGRCKLLVKGTPNGYRSTLGEITFTEDDEVFVLQCTNSSFIFKRDKEYIPQ